MRPARTKEREEAKSATAERQLSFSFEASEPHAKSLQTARAVALPRVATDVDDGEIVRLALEEALSRASGRPAKVDWTRNRRTMISSSRARGMLRVRAHRMFVEAAAPILEALVRYVTRGERQASSLLSEFIEEHRPRHVEKRARPVLCAIGKHHDLRRIFETLEARYFPGALAGVEIGWGRFGSQKRGRKRSIRLGTYTHDELLIRVHPALDQSWVPSYFVEYIVFHEMLHHVEPPREEDGRTVFHTSEFRRRERAYPGYARAIAWEAAHVGELLGPRGKNPARRAQL